MIQTLNTNPQWVDGFLYFMMILLLSSVLKCGHIRPLAKGRESQFMLQLKLYWRVFDPQKHSGRIIQLSYTINADSIKVSGQSELSSRTWLNCAPKKKNSQIFCCVSAAAAPYVFTCLCISTWWSSNVSLTFRTNRCRVGVLLKHVFTVNRSSC